MKKIFFHIFFSLLTINSLLFSSNNELLNKQNLTSSDTPAIIIDESIARLAHTLDSLNDIKIKDYQWEDTQDYTYTEQRLDRNKRLHIGSLMQQLIAHRHSDKKLSTIATPENELTIQEAFFNILLTSRCAEDEAAKLWYDQAFGAGEFYKKYGNYKKTTQFSPGHKFAKTVWGSDIINPHLLSINNLARISQMAMDTTADAWLSLKPIIDAKMNESK